VFFQPPIIRLFVIVFIQLLRRLFADGELVSPFFIQPNQKKCNRIVAQMITLHVAARLGLHSAYKFDPDSLG
jgi:hypothetical protein